MVATVRARQSTPFSIGRVLNDTFRVFRHISIPVIAIVLAANLALRFAYQSDTVGDIVAQGGQSWAGLLVRSFVTPLLSDLKQLFILFAVLRSIRREKVSAADFTRGFAAIPFVAGASIVTAMPYFLGAAAQKLLASTAIAIGITAFATGVAMLIVKLVFWVATPCIAAEGRGVFDGLKRSAQLTKGSRWAIFGLSMILSLAVVAILFTISVFTGVPFASLHAVTLTTPAGLMLFAADALSGAISLILVVVGYDHLRIEKDTFDTGTVAQVFD